MKRLVDRARFLLRGGYRLPVPYVCEKHEPITEWLNEHLPGRWCYKRPPLTLRQRGFAVRTWFRERWIGRDRRSRLDAILEDARAMALHPPRSDCFVFQHEADLVMFRLRWAEDIAEMSKGAEAGRVIIPVLRRVMPRIIAQDIIGVSPMTGPVAQIQALRVRYADAEEAKRIEQGRRWWQFWKR